MTRLLYRMESLIGGSNAAFIIGGIIGAVVAVAATAFALKAGAAIAGCELRAGKRLVRS